jgi:hypothetical protein
LKDNKGDSRNIILKKIPFTGEHGMLSNYFEVAASSHPPVNSSSITVKKKAIQSIGGFPVGISSGEDLLTWAKLMARFELAYSIKPFSIFIQDAAHTYDDKPNRLPQEPDRVGEELIILAKNSKHMRGIRSYVSLWFKMRSSIYIRFGMKKKALNEIMRALIYNPLNWKLFFYILLLIAGKSRVNSLFHKFGNA